MTPKTRFLPIHKKWDPIFDHISQTEQIHDVVVSGGDTFALDAQQILHIGNRLLSIPHIRRIRFASKGLAVCPSRIVDEDDDWANALIEISNLGRTLGKSVALHTHFNHPNEISWITTLAAQKLFENSVIVRNQSVLLNGVNNNVQTLSLLIRSLADTNIQPVSINSGHSKLEALIDISGSIMSTKAT